MILLKGKRSYYIKSLCFCLTTPWRNYNNEVPRNLKTEVGFTQLSQRDSDALNLSRDYLILPLPSYPLCFLNLNINFDFIQRVMKNDISDPFALETVGACYPENK